MKVLLVNSFLHARGGDTTCLFTSWRGLEAAGHTVIPFAMRHPANLPSVWETRFPAQIEARAATGAARVLAAAAAIWSPGAAAAMREVLRDVRPDVAHLHHVHRHLTPSILGPLRAAGVPVVWTLHDYEVVCPNAHLYTQGAPCERCRGHRYQEAVAHRCKRESQSESLAVAVEKWVHHRLRVTERVDRFVAPSRHLADTLVRFGIPAERVLHLPNPVEALPAGGPGEGWLYAGRLTAEKGLEDLLEAARQVPAPLDVYGGGPEAARWRARAPANVRFHGVVDAATLAGALRRTAVVVVPSRWPENLPYAVLEAQLAGRAVVATAVGGIPELVEDGVDGALVPPGAPAVLARRVAALLADSAGARAMGERARERVLARHDVQQHVRALERLYRSVATLP